MSAKPAGVLAPGSVFNNTFCQKIQENKNYCTNWHVKQKQ
jgi:hypothetical protein